jgi:hypothetical protein
MSRYHLVFACMTLVACTAHPTSGQESKARPHPKGEPTQVKGHPSAALIHSADVASLQLPANPPFSPKYVALRERFLVNFFHEGQVAAWTTPPGSVTFSDQTLYLGFALLTFAGEARILHDSGHDPRPAEAVVARLLRAFEDLERRAGERYHVPADGFFLRDSVTNWPKYSQVSSDFGSSDRTKADVSLDQVCSLIPGFWAVRHWSTDAANRRLAQTEATQVMDYLGTERYMIDRPGTHTEVSRGGDARGAAGFLCRIAEQITDQSRYGKDKVRLTHDNRCHTCGGTGEINVPDPNLECPACHGKGDCKIVVGGGRCEVCRGTGDVKLVIEQGCPACRGSGEIRVVVTDFWGNDHTLGSTKCGLCGGSGKIGGKTELGKCKVCHGSGRLPEYTKDLGRCKLCGGSGRLKGTLPKIKCPVCGGSKELNLYVRVTHPLIVGLLDLKAPEAALAFDAPAIALHHGKLSIQGNNRAVLSSYERHMALELMAFEKWVPDSVLLALAEDSKHPWSVALRAAINATVCPSCGGLGRAVLEANEQVVGLGLPHIPLPQPKRHDLGPCAHCRGTGGGVAKAEGLALLNTVLGQLERLHRECPISGPSDRSPSVNWCKDNRWVRCTELTRAANGTQSYNGLDFLSMEVLIRLAGAGHRL